MAKKCCVLILVAAILAAVLRLPDLALRPMHTDEAVHADKFGTLLEKGEYRYDPYDYHGPTLNYFTLIPAWLGSVHNLSDISEFTLRIVPVFFGVVLVLLLVLLCDGLGCTAVVCAAVLTAVSPAFVFYSRYYIQEMLLVCFTFGVISCGYRYVRTGSIGWALLTGMCLGLCYVTKETCVIAFGCMLLALLLAYLIRDRQGGAVSDAVRTIKPLHLVAAVAAAAVIAAMFCSSFFTNLQGIWDSLQAYAVYFNKAGRNQSHIHPWYYYLKMLVYYKYASGPVWSEAIIIILAVIGFVVALTKKGLSLVDFNLLRFIAFYTVAMTVCYSAIPYKTPWCLLGFLNGMILLAGAGAATLIKLSSGIFIKVFVVLLLLVGGLHLAWQAYLGSYKFYADTCNPYVYAHTSTDVYVIVNRVEEIARVHPDGRNMYIQVICPGYDYWPLPWYFRSFPRVGYYDKVDVNTPAAQVIIASPTVKPALLRKLYELPPPGERNLYVPLFDGYVELRPGVELHGLVTKDLWDRFQHRRSQSTSLSTKISR